MSYLKALRVLLFALLAGFTLPAVADYHVVQSERVVSWQDGSVRVLYSSRVAVPGTVEKNHSSVVVVREFKTYWITQPNGLGRVRVTGPVQYFLSSWDVKALELELQRLGIKVKPKPVPRPAPVVSG